MKKYYSNHQGFTMVELLVSAGILVVIASFVLANFRAGQQGSEFRVIVPQVVDAITTVRTMTLAGQLVADPNSPATTIFPAGGFGASISLSTADQVTLFADFNSSGTNNNASEPLVNGLIRLPKVNFIELCGLADSTVSTLPCNAGWANLGTTLNILFPAPGVVVANDGTNNPLLFQYVGGTFRQTATGRQGYFYVSLISGLVSGGEL